MEIPKSFYDGRLERAGREKLNAGCLFQPGEAGMNSVELLEQALDAATRLGYEIRQEWLAGGSGGKCELKGQKLLFLDLDLDPAERLELVLDILRCEPGLPAIPMPRELGELLSFIAETSS